ncbi:putative Cu-dependent DNA-binding protein [Aspergillus luchuensis]|uniref:Uncharacterized protein n=1 Tax=Aspergillus kawachii TaxID=1069201 RepID=A0A7R7X6M4_ASPKA|nr:uncharacterized protein AKAW2_71040A [Aspergillus luchuensis]BCS04162.1 hypothetical protein AKAW2_71040A [Aspergillus luchuensis]BCS15757.1 hypothetical protein ALUC_70990A [Aspergillus luchuensis]
MLIDGEKWACEACVRGHRVTTCKHNDRPLIRINRKGRPFATCSICNCTPCESPEEHAKLKRETDHHHPSSSSKRAADRSPRLSASPSTFLPIAPRPSVSPSTSATSPNSSLPAAASAYAAVSVAATLPGSTTATAAGYLSPPPIASLPPSFCSMAATTDSMSMSMVNPLLVDAHRMYSDLAVSFADSNAIYALEDMGLDDVSATMLAADPVFQGNDWDWLHDDHHDGGVL